MSMSLWNIEQGLADLMEQREEAIELREGADHVRQRLVEIDLAIADYIKAEVKKVDGVRAWWKHLEMMRDAAEDEANAMKYRAQAFDRQLTVLKNAIQITMEEMVFRGTPRKLEGKTGSISLVGNGGRRPVVITDEALVPDEYRTVTVKMNAELWRKICVALPDLAGLQECRKEPSMTAIYNALEQPCGTCAATGILFSANPNCTEKCTSCGGSGKQGVPGAVLAPLGVHVRVK